MAAYPSVRESKSLRSILSQLPLRADIATHEILPFLEPGCEELTYNTRACQLGLDYEEDDENVQYIKERKKNCFKYCSTHCEWMENLLMNLPNRVQVWDEKRWVESNIIERGFGGMSGVEILIPAFRFTKYPGSSVWRLTRRIDWPIPGEDPARIWDSFNISTAEVAKQLCHSMTQNPRYTIIFKLTFHHPPWNIVEPLKFVTNLENYPAYMIEEHKQRMRANLGTRVGTGVLEYPELKIKWPEFDYPPLNGRWVGKNEDWQGRISEIGIPTPGGVGYQTGFQLELSILFPQQHKERYLSTMEGFKLESEEKERQERERMMKTPRFQFLTRAFGGF